MKLYNGRNFYVNDNEDLKEIPLILSKHGLEYRLVKEYPNFWLYVHYHNKGKWYECFDRHDLRVIERYGSC